MQQDNVDPGTAPAMKALLGLKFEDRELLNTNIRTLAALVGSDSGVFSVVFAQLQDWEMYWDHVFSGPVAAPADTLWPAKHAKDLSMRNFSAI